ncbi:uncharacterized protein LOC116415978 [Nasonia vitripennis]|uniref:Uncharacterized protein n=1 Tax=Nasonia vitripennis TaxID=7425 RepID=A0A7M7PY83_NASVI|nr:uncharacterized protein LOC116415978 [Nasonia vitripennis]
MIFSLLMYNYYSACVVSARLDEPIYKINDSLNEFGKLHMKMASEAMVYLEFFLKKPDWDTTQFYRNYWTKLPENEKLMNPDKGMQLVKEGGFAYHTHPVVGYPIIDKLFDNREICELMEVHVARPTRTAFGATMNSSFVEIARVGFTKINEVGLRHRQYLRWSHRKPPCRKDILSAVSINIYEFAPHLLLLAVGIMMSTTLCLIEVILVNHGMCINIRNIVCAEHVIQLNY